MDSNHIVAREKKREGKKKGKEKKKRKQELNKVLSETFGFGLSVVPFKVIILKNVYAAEAFLLHIKNLEKQEKEINASFKINHYWYSL